MSSDSVRPTYPLCFVLMPFGKKPNEKGQMIDFDKVYEDLIKPAITTAQLEPIRADEEKVGGIIHKPMFERLILCPYAVADLTLANANVLYELGVRHAVRPFSTVSIFAEGTWLPFDVNMLRGMPYALTENGLPGNVDANRDALARKLREAKEGMDDSPVFQLMDLPWRDKCNELAHEKTDAFREQAVYSDDRKRQLAAARQQRTVDAIREIEQDIVSKLGSLENEEIGVVVDLFLSYRSVKAWDEMIRLVDAMSRLVSQTVMVQEQLALALNRAAGEAFKQGDEAKCRTLRDRAITILKGLIGRRGASGETNGILGRVYKDAWEEARNQGKEAVANSWLEEAIATYLEGFEADWRDAYPGINAVTLMEIKDPPDDRRKELLPVVTYAVERKIASKEPDYWDHATLLELAVLADDQTNADKALGASLRSQREIWEPETTARNLRLIREAREHRGERVDWLVATIRQLDEAAESK